MSADQKIAMEDKAKARKEKQDEKDAAALKELNNIRANYGRQPIAEQSLSNKQKEWFRTTLLLFLLINSYQS